MHHIATQEAYQTLQVFQKNLFFRLFTHVRKHGWHVNMQSCTKSFTLSIAFTFQLMTLFCTYLALCSYGGYGGLSYSI